MQLTKAELLLQLASLFPDNNSGQITPQRVRDYLTNVLDSTYVKSEITIQQNNEFVNVKDYGAVGDGTTEDQAAFNDALATRKNVYVPEGYYLLKEQLTTFPNQHLVGAGVFTNLIFEGTFPDDKCLILSEGAKLSNIHIKTEEAITLISIENVGIVLDSLLLKSAAKAVAIAYTTGATNTPVYVHSCTVYESDTAIYLDRDNLAPVQINHCLLNENAVGLDLHSFLVGISDTTIIGERLILLRNDNTEANPVITFNRCKLKATSEDPGTGVNSEVNNTSYVLTFNECTIEQMSVKMVSNHHAIVQFTRCDITSMVQALTGTEVVAKYNDNVLRSNIFPDLVGFTVEYGTNIQYDEGLERYLIKTAL